MLLRGSRQFLTWMLVRVVLVYQWTLGLMLRPRCRFYPSCSEYAKLALESRRPLCALGLIAKRLLKCHPWHPGGLDPLPQKESL